MSSDSNESSVLLLKKNRAIVEDTLRDPNIGPEARSELAKGLLEIDDMLNEMMGSAPTSHKNGGAVMKKRGGTFKGIF